MQIEIIYFATFGMIFFDFLDFEEDIKDQGSNFVEKDDLSPYKIFSVKRGTVIPNVGGCI